MGRPPQCNCWCSDEFTICELSPTDGERLNQANYSYGQLLASGNNLFHVRLGGQLYKLNASLASLWLVDHSVAVSDNGSCDVTGAGDFVGVSGSNLLSIAGADGSIDWSTAVGSSVVRVNGSSIYMAGRTYRAAYSTSGALQWENTTSDGPGGSVLQVAGASLYCLSSATSGLVRYSASDGAYIDHTAAPGSGSMEHLEPVSGGLVLCRGSQAIKLTSGLSTSWTTTVSGTGVAVYCAKQDASGNIYLGGMATVDGVATGAVWKLNSSGAEQWGVAIGYSVGHPAWVRDVAVTDDGRLFVNSGDHSTT